MTIETTDYSLQIHDTIDDLGLSDSIDFMKLDAKYVKAVQEERDIEAIDLLKQGVKIMVPELPDELDIFGDDDDKPLLDTTANDLSVSRIYFHYVDLLDQYFLRLIEAIKNDLVDNEDLAEATKKLIAKDLDELSVDELCTLVLVVSEATGMIEVDDSKLSFPINGTWYHIQKKDVHEKYESKNLKVGQVSLIKEFRRRTKQHQSEKLDSDGTMMFNLGIYELACLALKENEDIPTHPAEQKVFLDQRMALFGESIKITTYFNICFFLTLTLIEFGVTKITYMLSTKSTSKESKYHKARLQSSIARRKRIRQNSKRRR